MDLWILGSPFLVPASGCNLFLTVLSHRWEVESNVSTQLVGSWCDAGPFGRFRVIVAGGCPRVAHGAAAPVLAVVGGVRVVIDAQGALIDGIPDTTDGGTRVVVAAVEVSGVCTQGVCVTSDD